MRLFNKKVIELRECPMCHKLPHIERYGMKNKLHICVCRDCNVHKLAGEKTEKKAIKEWNEYATYMSEVITRVEQQRKLREQEKLMEELSKKEHLTEEEKQFVRNYYRSLFLGSLSSKHITVIEK